MNTPRDSEVKRAMKVLLAAYLVALPAIALASGNGCPVSELNRYFVSFVDVSPPATQQREVVIDKCVERKIMTDADWKWLEGKLATELQVRKVSVTNVIPAAQPLSDY